MRCDLRTFHECSCPPDQCVSAPVHRISDEPPVFTASNRMLVAIIGFVAVVSLFVFFAIPRADAAFHQMDLAQQEMRHG